MTELQLRCEIEALVCERAGAIAMNMQRKYLRQAMAYNDHYFFLLAEKLRALSKEEVGHGQEQD